MFFFLADDFNGDGWGGANYGLCTLQLGGVK